MTTRDIRRDVINLVNRSGILNVTDVYNSMKTTKGTDASRQMTVSIRADISGTNDECYLKFDPDPRQAVSVTRTGYVKYDPKNPQHEELPKYVRVKGTHYKGDYDPVYKVYAAINNRNVFGKPYLVINQSDFNALAGKIVKIHGYNK